MTHHPITRAEYDALPGINNSKLRWIQQSPEHFQYYCANPPSQTPAMIFGLYVDSLVFESDFPHVVSPYPDFKTKEAQAWRKAQPVPVITQDQKQRADALLEALYHSSAATEILGNGFGRVAYTSSMDGTATKCLPDWIYPGVIIDLKITTDASFEAFQRKILDMGYDVQGAFYQRSVEQETQEPHRFGWIVVEDEAPHAVAVWIADAGILKRGASILDSRLTTYRQCMTSGVWPGYTRKPTEITLPAWEERKWNPVSGILPGT